jgi:hypothetical protein
MAAQKRDPELLRQTLDAVNEHGSVKAAARALGLPYATVQHRYDAAQREVQSPVTESLSVSGDSAELTRTVHQRIKTLADLVRVCEIDPAEWDVERWVCNKWDSAAKLGKDKTERIAVTELFQVKAWLKRNRPVMAARAEIASLLADAKAKMPKRVTIVRSLKPATNLLFEPHIPDLHAGKLAWADETGWENYDLRTAERIFDAAIDTLIARAKSFGCDRVLLPWGNDLLHSDTKQGTTTGGTQLDTDSRFQKVFQTVRRMSVRTIDRLREEVGPVTVTLVPGNHDALSVWHLGDSLECWYRQAKGVTIDNAPTLRKYHQHGKVMLMFTHGNRGKLEKYPELMAAEQPAMWGATVHREAHTGDKHHQRVLELKGCRVRISPALCATDAWHSEMHFVGSQRAAEAFIWDANEGLIGTAFYTVPKEGAA